MWPFLFVLAIVPLAFYWSDSVTEVFPALAKYFPEKKSATEVGPNGEPIADAEQAATAKTKWIELQSEDGYVAYAMSPDGQYRIAVGCRNDEPAALQVTYITGATLPTTLSVNYTYGVLPLTSGAFAGGELVGAVSQFGDVYVQSDERLITRFNLPKHESGLIARSLQSNCPELQ